MKANLSSGLRVSSVMSLRKMDALGTMLSGNLQQSTFETGKMVKNLEQCIKMKILHFHILYLVLQIE